ncbi:MAG: M20/M25/M40 family metallo-hydrolase [Coprococcus sp.]
MSWQENIVEDFVELVSYDSISFHERKTADWIISRLKGLGFYVNEDDGGKHYGGDTGNIFARLKGDIEGAPILFSSHMDVVEPGTGKKAVVEDGFIRSKGDTVLGADDISGILEIIYGIELLLKSGKPHRDIELLFTIGEELYVKGSDVFDYSVVTADRAYVLDLSGPVGSAARRAPSIISIKAEIVGKAAHAGFEPENGIHAIQAAGKAISRLDMGHVDEDTTFNIGTIKGGTATNIVPDSCEVTGEIRSYNHINAMAYVDKAKQIFAEEAEKIGATSDVTYEVHLMAYETPEDSHVVEGFKNACRKLGLSGEVGSTFGGSDNNSFARNGIEGLVISCGMYNAHSVNEYTTVDDLYRGTELVAELLSE